MEERNYRPFNNNQYEANKLIESVRQQPPPVDEHKHHSGHQHQSNNPEWYNRHEYEVHENRQPLETAKKVGKNV